MLYVMCQICSKSFYTKLNWVKLGGGKYCSRKCCNIAQKKWQSCEMFYM
jgi:hypothetical protein